MSARGGDRENRAGWRNRMDDQSRTGLLARGENRGYDGPWRIRVGEQNGAVGEAVLGCGYGRERWSRHSRGWYGHNAWREYRASAPARRDDEQREVRMGGQDRAGLPAREGLQEMPARGDDREGDERRQMRMDGPNRAGLSAREGSEEREETPARG